MGTNVGTFLTFVSLYTTFCEVAYNGLLSGSVSTVDSYRHEVRAVHLLLVMMAHKTHFRSFPLLMVLSIICSLFFHSLATRIGLWHLWEQSCCTSPTGHLRPRHIFCEAAGTMDDSGSPSSYMFQLLLPIFSCPVSRITVASNSWVQEWMKYSQGVFWSWEFLGYCSLRYFLSSLHCIRATDF